MPNIRNAKEMVAEANAAVEAVPAGQAVALAGDPDVVFVDVRDAAEREKTGTARGAVHAPRAFLEFLADPASERHLPALSPNKRLVLFCATGGRLALLLNVGPGVLLDFGPPAIPQPTVSRVTRGARSGLERQGGFVRAASPGA